MPAKIERGHSTLTLSDYLHCCIAYSIDVVFYVMWMHSEGVKEPRRYWVRASKSWRIAPTINPRYIQYIVYLLSMNL